MEHRAGNVTREGDSLLCLLNSFVEHVSSEQGGIEGHLVGVGEDENEDSDESPNEGVGPVHPCITIIAICNIDHCDGWVEEPARDWADGDIPCSDGGADDEAGEGLLVAVKAAGLVSTGIGGDV